MSFQILLTEDQPVPQFRKRGTVEWFDGYPDPSRDWPYETRTFYKSADLATQQAPTLHETDIYDFAGWLTTRPGVMSVGATSLATPMADAVAEYIKTFPERFQAAQQAAEPSDEQILHLVDTHVGGPTPSYPLDNNDWINFARAVLALRPSPAPEFDVRTILLDIVPGDGNGLEVYAKNVDDVVTKLTELSVRLDEAERKAAPAVTEGDRKELKGTQ